MNVNWLAVIILAKRQGSLSCCIDLKCNAQIYF